MNTIQNPITNDMITGVEAVRLQRNLLIKAEVIMKYTIIVKHLENRVY